MVVELNRSVIEACSVASLKYQLLSPSMHLHLLSLIIHSSLLHLYYCNRHLIALAVGVCVWNVKTMQCSMNLVRYSDVMSRIVAMALTLVAVVLTAFDKESEDVPVSITTALPAVYVRVTAKWQYLSAFVYFLVSNAIAGSYAIASVLVSMAVNGGLSEKGELGLVMMDLLVMALLFSANGAAMGIGIMGRDGNSHVHWNKVCNAFHGFCRRLTAAIVLSLLGSFVFLWLVALAIVNLYKKRHTSSK